MCGADVIGACMCCPVALVESGIGQIWAVHVVMIRFCPHFIFIFSLPFFQSHDLMSPDRSPDLCHLTLLSHDHPLLFSFSICLAAHCPPYMGTLLSLGLLFHSPLFSLAIVFVPIVSRSPIVRLIRTLSHGSCLRSI